MKRHFPIATLFCFLFIAAVPVLAQPKPAAIYGEGVYSFRLTTGRPGELGLLEQLALAFAKKAETTMS